MRLELTFSPFRRGEDIVGGMITIRKMEEPHFDAVHYTAREYEKLLSSTLEAIDDTLIVRDSEYSIVLSNVESERNEWKKCYEVLMNRESPCRDCPVDRVFQTGRTPIGKREVKDGEKVKEVSMYPIRNDSEEVEFVVEHVRDVSQEKERNLLLRNAQIANNELESFSYTVSHDLRAPLRNIKGYTRALWEDFQETMRDKNLKYLQRIEAGAEKMEEIIDSILTLSRIDRHQPEFGKVDISELFRKYSESLREEHPDRDVEVVIEPGLSVWGDEKLLDLVASNLLSNAWKYSSYKERARIEFGVIRREKKKIFYISDNGAGFDKDSAKKLFQPFTRLHSQKEFTGLGIGLATVRRIIMRHGGDIWAVGREGRGATFYFTVPRNYERGKL